MALLKLVTKKGIPLTYWAMIKHVQDKEIGSTYSEMWGFRSAESRQESLDNCIHKEPYSFPGDNDKTEMYRLIKQPRVLVGSEEDSNPLSNAVDC